MNRLWEKHYTEQVPGSLFYPEHAIDHFLKDSAEAFPRRPALIFEGARITYRALDGMVDACAAGLHALGITKGDRVALLLPNCPQMVISFYAIFRLGAVAVPLNPLYQEREIAYQITNADARAMISLDLLYPRAEALVCSSPSLIPIITALSDYLPPLKKIIYPLVNSPEREVPVSAAPSRAVQFRDLLASGRSRKMPDVSVAPHDTALLQYTGGTTGVSKGAELTHANIVANTLQSVSWYCIIRRGEEIILAVLPLFHTYGIAVCMNLAIATGSTMVLIPRFAARDILKAIQAYGVTFFPAIPAMYAALNNYRDIHKWDISSVRYCVSGSAPLPLQTMRDFENRTGGIILEGYGLTEASPVTHSNPVHRERKAGSIGLPLADTDCKIVDLDDGTRDVAPGEPGELCIKGPQVMKGYWHMPSETEQVLRGGWLHTGDIARMDDEGYFFIMDRKKDMIISEGFNIYPHEIDEVALKHPAIADAAAVGVPDTLRGEKVVLYAVLRDGVEVTADEVLAFCREQLAKYKVPKKVIFRHELPKTAVGKVLRRALRDEAMHS